MLSAIFVDRPRFAIVIALVISIAGLVSLLVIPLAQYPDIVPPQVQVTTTYPGANSASRTHKIFSAHRCKATGCDHSSGTPALRSPAK
jgi:multidrug efflux pump subunit AcrB